MRNFENKINNPKYLSAGQEYRHATFSKLIRKFNIINKKYLYNIEGSVTYALMEI